MTEKYHMTEVKSKPYKGRFALLVFILLLFLDFRITYAATITYTYDNLHRLSRVDYEK